MWQMMYKKLNTYFLAPYSEGSLLEMKRAKALYYYIPSAVIILSVIYLHMALIVPRTMSPAGSIILILWSTAILALFLLRKGRYNIAANSVTMVILLSIIVELVVRVSIDPLTSYTPNSYLLIAVIVQASLFCSKKWVLFYIALTIFATIGIYFFVRDKIPLGSMQTLEITSIYFSLSIIVIAIMSRLANRIFASAFDKLELELKSNDKQLNKTRRLYESSEKLLKEYKIVKEVSLKDSLTGLRNRRYVEEVVSCEVGAFIKQKASILKLGKNQRSTNLDVYGLFLINIDHFKEVNDQYGHDLGDRVLKELTDIINRSIRENDVAIRWGGEDFLVVLKNTKTDYLTVFAEKLRACIQEHEFIIGKDKIISITCSIGFTRVPINDDPAGIYKLDDYIAITDLALYYSKDLGRNRWTGIENGVSGISTENMDVVTHSLNAAVQKKIITIKIGTKDYVETID